MIFLAYNYYQQPENRNKDVTAPNYLSYYNTNICLTTLSLPISMGNRNQDETVPNRYYFCIKLKNNLHAWSPVATDITSTKHHQFQFGTILLVLNAK